jgi:hypothetical protein
MNKRCGLRPELHSVDSNGRRGDRTADRNGTLAGQINDGLYGCVAPRDEHIRFRAPANPRLTNAEGELPFIELKVGHDQLDKLGVPAEAGKRRW